MSATCGPIGALALARDQPGELRAASRDGLASWAQSGFHFQHLCAMDGLIHADLYEGRVAAAIEHLESRWSELERSLLMRAQFIRINIWLLRGNLALAAAGDEPRAAHRSRVERAIAAIDRERMPWARGPALALRAGLARLRGDATAAGALLEQAERRYAEADMGLHVAVCQLQRGLVLGAAGDAARARGTARLIEEGVQRPIQFAATFMPVAGPPALA
jgi:hypothetical protein